MGEGDPEGAGGSRLEKAEDRTEREDYSTEGVRRMERKGAVGKGEERREEASGEI